MSNGRIREVLVRHGSTVLVFGALAGVAWWGHHTGWKFSKPAETSKTAEDWCEPHGVPKSTCLACNPELGGASAADWCKEHGVPESKCTICHPEILKGGVAADWCKEHGVPESACPQCHPEIAMKGEAPPSETGATVTADPSAKPDPSSTCQTHLVRIQFASPEAVRKAGVSVEAVQERPMATNVTAPGEIRYDETRVARLSPRAAGTVVRVEKAVGQEVKRGDVLALVDAIEVGRAKSELLQALAQVDVKAAAIERVRAAVKQSELIVAVKTRAHDRLKSSAKEGFRSEADVQEAEAAVAEAEAETLKVRMELQEAEAALNESRIRLVTAQQELANLGLRIDLSELETLPAHEVLEKVMQAGIPDEVLHALDDESTANLVPVVAPLDGVVVSAEAIAGEVVETGKPLFVVADVRHMWVVLEVRQEDLAGVAVGKAVTFRPDADEAGPVVGKVAWISTAADETTRTVKVRADVANEGGRLRANAFGTGRIVVRESPNATAVPTPSIHWEGCHNVVFVRLTDDIFQTRKVNVGARNPTFTEVIGGVLPGEVVATTGSYVLKSMLLRDKLGAG